MEKLKFQTFTPGELSQITGVDNVTLRDWRRRELIEREANGRHARYALCNVCWMFALKEAIDAGIPPKSALDFASGAMNEIEFAVLRKLGHAKGGTSTYIVWSKRRGGTSICRDLVQAMDYFKKDRVLLLMSCDAVAAEIIERAPKPLVLDPR